MVGKASLMAALLRRLHDLLDRRPDDRARCAENEGQAIWLVATAQDMKLNLGPFIVTAIVAKLA